jgi:hypothetical protein
MVASFSEKTPPGFDRKSDVYDKWKKRFQLWRDITDVTKAKQGGLLVLCLDDETQEAVLDKVTNVQIKSEEGVTVIFSYLDNLFKVDESVSAYEAYEEFKCYRRPGELSISDYCREFNRRYAKVKKDGTKLAEHLLGFKLLKSAGLKRNEELLIKATVVEMSYEAVMHQLKKVFNGSSTSEMSGSSADVTVKEPIDYTHNVAYRGTRLDRKFNGYGQRDPYSQIENFDQRGNYGSDNRWDDRKQNRDAKGNNSKRCRGKNAIDSYGNVTRCRICESINHWEKHCPDLRNRGQDICQKGLQFGSGHTEMRLPYMVDSGTNDKVEDRIVHEVLSESSSSYVAVQKAVFKDIEDYEASDMSVEDGDHNTPTDRRTLNCPFCDAEVEGESHICEELALTLHQGILDTVEFEKIPKNKLHEFRPSLECKDFRNHENNDLILRNQCKQLEEKVSDYCKCDGQKLDQRLECARTKVRNSLPRNAMDTSKMTSSPMTFTSLGLSESTALNCTSKQSLIKETQPSLRVAPCRRSNRNKRRGVYNTKETYCVAGNRLSCTYTHWDTLYEGPATVLDRETKKISKRSQSYERIHARINTGILLDKQTKKAWKRRKKKRTINRNHPCNLVLQKNKKLEVWKRRKRNCNRRKEREKTVTYKKLWKRRKKRKKLVGSYILVMKTLG